VVTVGPAFAFRASVNHNPPAKIFSPSHYFFAKYGRLNRRHGPIEILFILFSRLPKLRIFLRKLITPNSFASHTGSLNLPLKQSLTLKFLDCPGH
jgi:hypothetical protein